MDKSRSNSKIKIPKVKASNENISPMKLEMEDQLLIGRGRYHQSMSLSPSFQPYVENLDLSTPLARYLRTGSSISDQISPSGESFTSQTFGSRKYRSAIVQQHNSSSSGNSSSGSRNRLSVSPLSPIENLDIMPLMSSPVYGTPVKVEEEVLVMDDIQVRPTSGGKRPVVDVGKKFARGKEMRPGRLSSMNKSEASKSSSVTGSCTCGPRSRNVHRFQAAAGSEDAVSTPKPASPFKPESDHTLAISDWSPLDDGIKLVLPHGSANNPPSREEVTAYISNILYGPSTKRRLPVFSELCYEQDLHD